MLKDEYWVPRCVCGQPMVGHVPDEMHDTATPPPLSHHKDGCLGHTQAVFVDVVTGRCRECAEVVVPPRVLVRRPKLEIVSRVLGDPLLQELVRPKEEDEEVEEGVSRLPGLTVHQLREALAGLDGDLPVIVRSEPFTGGILSAALEDNCGGLALVLDCSDDEDDFAEIADVE